MTTLRTIIVDDEQSVREALRNILDQFCPEVQVVDMADSVRSALVAITNHRPDLVFLDIEMPEADGFELLESFDSIDFEVIFVSAYNQYVFKAFKFFALDYLLKPVDVDALQAAVARAAEKKENDISKKNIEYLVHQLRSSNSNNFEKIALPTSNEILFVNLKDIVRCESSSNYTYFYMTDGRKAVVTKTLKEYEGILSEHNFLRVHQTHLINLAHIKKYLKGEGGSVIMQDDVEVPVSRRKKEALLTRMKYT